MGLMITLVVAIGVIGCGDGAGADSPGRTLGEQETKELLRQLPYRYRFRQVTTPLGAEGVVAGMAIGSHKTILNFGIALGTSPGSVPVPHAGTSGSYRYPGGGFVFTDDLLVKAKNGKTVAGKQFRTRAQWLEAGHMEVEMTAKLCEASTGEPCPL